MVSVLKKERKCVKFKDFSLIGFSPSQVKRIRRKYNPEDVVGINLTQDIADLTGYSVGLVVAPGEPLKIVRLNREV